MSASNVQAGKTDENLNDFTSISSSASNEIAEKPCETDFERKKLKEEKLESELKKKDIEIEERNDEIQTLLDGITMLNNVIHELESKLQGKEVELNEMKSQVSNQEELFCIKSLLDSQKSSIIESCIDMLNDKEKSQVVIKAGMEVSDNTKVSEIVIKKEEIITKSWSDLAKLEVGPIDLAKDLEQKKMIIENLETTLDIKNKKIEDQQTQIEAFSDDFLKVKALEVQAEKEKKLTRKLFNYFGIESTGSTAMDLIDALSENKRLSTTLELEKQNTSNAIQEYERKLREQRENWTRSDSTPFCQENIWTPWPNLTLNGLQSQMDKEKFVKWSNLKDVDW
jgi:hypothetical protein